MIKYLAGFLGFTAITLGAIGSHALKLDAMAQHSFEIATRYQRSSRPVLSYLDVCFSAVYRVGTPVTEGTSHRTVLVLFTYGSSERLGFIRFNEIPQGMAGFRPHVIPS